VLLIVFKSILAIVFSYS